jgi:D-alanyl-D-alanine carboxypeptidase (penicillin-binding protein 5/6)
MQELMKVKLYSITASVFFETHMLYQGLETLSEPRIWKGDSKQAPMGLESDLYVTIPRRHYNDLKAEINIDNKIVAPIKKGQTFGFVNVSLAGEVIANKPLVALKAIGKGGFVDRLYDEALLLLE